MTTEVQTQARERDARVTPAVDGEQSGKPTGSVALRVTAQILQALQHGVRPWVQPWSNASALALPLRANGAAYRGVNVLVLWAAAQTRGYQARHWLSFKQAQALGGAVRRGERATQVIYYSGARQDAGPNKEEEGDKRSPKRAVLRAYAVFNADQIERLPAHFYAPPAPVEDLDEARLAALFERVPAAVRYGGARACYVPSTDTICMPPRHAFSDGCQFYATLAHELAHWTRHPSRLDRDFGSNRYGDAGYSREELVAELTAAFIGAELGLPVDHIECHAAYIDSWLKILDRDPGALMQAAGKAQAAADFLWKFWQPET